MPRAIAILFCMRTLANSFTLDTVAIAVGFWAVGAGMQALPVLSDVTSNPLRKAAVIGAPPSGPSRQETFESFWLVATWNRARSGELGWPIVVGSKTRPAVEKGRKSTEPAAIPRSMWQA